MKSGVLKHPGRWIWLPVIALAAIGLLRLRFDAEVFDLLPADLPVVQGLKLYQQYFANARDLIITLQAEKLEQAQAAAREIATRLRPMTNLVASATWQAPWMEHPEQMSELLAYLWFNLPPATFHSLLNRFTPEHLSNAFETAREDLATSLSPEDIARLSYDPLGLTKLPGNAQSAAPAFANSDALFSSQDGKFRVVYVRARGNLHDFRECARWLNAIRPMVSAAIASTGGAERNDDP